METSASSCVIFSSHKVSIECGWPFSSSPPRWFTVAWTCGGIVQNLLNLTLAHDFILFCCLLFSQSHAGISSSPAVPARACSAPRTAHRRVAFSPASSCSGTLESARYEMWKVGSCSSESGTARSHVSELAQLGTDASQKLARTASRPARSSPRTWEAHTGLGAGRGDVFEPQRLDRVAAERGAVVDGRKHQRLHLGAAERRPELQQRAADLHPVRPFDGR
eukprot:331979-Rhodomonas_salina.3